MRKCQKISISVSSFIHMTKSISVGARQQRIRSSMSYPRGHSLYMAMVHYLLKCSLVAPREILEEAEQLVFLSFESLTNLLHKISSSQTYITDEIFPKMITCVLRKLSSLFKFACFTIKSDSSDGKSCRNQGHEGYMKN